MKLIIDNRESNDPVLLKHLPAGSAFIMEASPDEIFISSGKVAMYDICGQQKPFIVCISIADDDIDANGYMETTQVIPIEITEVHYKK